MYLERDEFAVTYNPAQTNSDALLQTIKDAGYTARIVTGDSSQQNHESKSRIPTDLEPLATAFREAKEKRKPLLLDFHASWCVPCKQMENKTFTDQRVAALLDRFVVLKIDTDEQIELTESFGVAGLPDIRLLSVDGQHQKQLQGFQTVEAFIPALETFLESLKP